MPCFVRSGRGLKETVAVVVVAGVQLAAGIACPSGYVQLGSVGDGIPGWGLTNYLNKASDIDDCRGQCASQGPKCAGFEYTPDYRGRGYNLCSLRQIGQLSTAAQTVHEDDAITCTKQTLCHNLALPLTPDSVTVLEGCINAGDFNANHRLRGGSCELTKWRVPIPGCMLGSSGTLLFTFQSDEGSSRDVRDVIEVFVDGVKVATFVNDVCNTPVCRLSVPWHATYNSNSTLDIRSNSSNSNFFNHALILGITFEQQALCSNLAIPLTPDFVTVVDGCQHLSSDFDVLRTGNCHSTEWSLPVAPCMLGTTGRLLFDITSDESDSRDKSDFVEAFVDGSKAATFVNDNCRSQGSCRFSVPWDATATSLGLKSTSSNNQHHLHARIYGVSFQQDKSPPPTAFPEEYCADLFSGYNLICGRTAEGHCIMHVDTTYPDGSRGSCRRWCQSQGRQCVDAVDNYGHFFGPTCIVETVPPDFLQEQNADHEACDMEFLDMLCVCA